MKVSEIITEGSTALVARYHRDTSELIDQDFNPEANEYRKETQERYTENFNGDICSEDEGWSSRPDANARQSAGYRGLQYAFSRSGIPYDKEVQKYNPDYISYDVDIEQL